MIAINVNDMKHFSTTFVLFPPKNLVTAGITKAFVIPPKANCDANIMPITYSLTPSSLSINGSVDLLIEFITQVKNFINKKNQHSFPITDTLSNHFSSF